MNVIIELTVDSRAEAERLYHKYEDSEVRFLFDIYGAVKEVQIKKKMNVTPAMAELAIDNLFKK